MIVHKDNANLVADTLGLPCILKQPDSAFSQGVVKATTRAELDEEIERRLASSDLLIAQEYMPTDFDWRVGVLEGKVLYVCRYFMARHHWQIIKQTQRGGVRGGRVEPVATRRAPRDAMHLSVAAANLMGDGLYGVDIKQRGSDFFLIEVNDNPSIEAGYEDELVGDGLYLKIMKSLHRRILRLRGE
jgi:glutathione synthase/RimK-type ligase-like ATP-grasp enzyme